ncbi:MAG: hypothetical protein J6C55_01565 [Oscillospiraceae bacterium]|nr:hypothetical protein [Oscillospiraceae bacterium]
MINKQYKNNKFFEIDNRTKNDIITEIKDLAKSYVPEWIYNLDDPDVGSIIASIYAQFLEDDINNLNMLMYKYRIELMNMIGINLKKARPAESVVKFSLLQSADEGAYIPKKTKLVANGKDDSKIIFETKNSVYITNSNICNIYSTSRDLGKIINIFDLESEESNSKKSFYLFDYSSNGIERNELIIGHRYALNLNKDAVLEIFFDFDFEDNKNNNIIKNLCDYNKYEWKYLSDNNKYELFKDISFKDNKFILVKDKDSSLVASDNDLMYYISITQKDNTLSDILKIRDIKISSFCPDILPEIIYQGDYQVNIKEFFPFSDKLNVYNECYIASDDVFSKKDSEVTLKFNLSYFKNLVEMNFKNNQDYKIIMKKPQQQNYDIVDTKVQTVIFEYFNGIGWAKLNLDNNYYNLFSGENSGEVILKFICPSDIEKVSVNAYEKYWIRIRLLKADNCYRVPCYHLVPIINNLRLSYDYQSNGVSPEYLLSYKGVTEELITLDSSNLLDKLNKQESFIIFKPIDYRDNSLFIGFDKKFCDGPISLFFDIEGGFQKQTNNISFEYSSSDTEERFKRLKIIDETENLRHSGCVIFVAPGDMSELNIFNKNRYWLRIVDKENRFKNLKYIKINDIIVNTVKVENIETKDPEVFYIDRAVANMKFNLSSDNILSADVFVNEINDLSIKQMDDMLKQDPDNIIVEYDRSGNYLSFFVKWQEVDNFVKSKPDDRHYMLSRSENIISFGDSIRGRIPSKQLREAIRVFVIVCNGDNANVDIGSINKTDVMINFVNNITNPIPAYSGHDIETTLSALNRGANIISSFGRLVSENDFERAVKDFSDIIDKVKCVACVNEYGEKRPKEITIAVLIRDFQKNSGIFFELKNQIKNNLLEKSEISLREDDLNIIEPVFVELCVDVWVNIKDYNMSFEIKNNILKYLNLFIDPVGGNFYGNGWEIGKIPKEVQIYSFIKSQNIDAVIKKIIVTGKTKDINGVVEKELNQIENNPFIIGINGKHNVYIDFD